jgi:hypothetical protein
MDMKYADVLTLEAVVDHLDGVEAGLFDGEMPVLAIEGVKAFSPD